MNYIKFTGADKIAYTYLRPPIPSGGMKPYNHTGTCAPPKEVPYMERYGVATFCIELTEKQREDIASNGKLYINGPLPIDGVGCTVFIQTESEFKP